MRRQLAYACLALTSTLVLAFHNDLSAQIILSNGETNQIDGPSAEIEVYNGPGGQSDPTTLQVVDGAEIDSNDDDQSVGVFEDSIFEMTSGELAGTLELSDQATAHITGGTIGDTIVASDNTLLTIIDITAEDAVEAEDDAIVHLWGGIYENEILAVDNAVLNIHGGEFIAVFSDGESVIAEGGTVNISGGVFGEAGLDDGGSAVATLGGTLNYSGGQVAGIDTGDAPTATFSALINAEINLSDSEFAGLVLEAGNNGVLNASGYQAETVDVRAIAGGTVNLLGSGADVLTITAELAGVVNLFGGEFADIDASLLSQGVLNVYGHSFKYNNVPLENLDAVFGPGGYIESTGEIRFVAGLLSGVFRNGDPFELSFARSAIEGARVFVQSVPEPNSIALGFVAAMTILSLRRD